MNNAAQPENSVTQTLPHSVQGTMDLLDILLMLARRRRMICIATVCALLVGVCASLILKPDFTATAVILPPQQQSSSSALLSQLGSLASIGGGSGGLGLKSPSDMYVGILQSRTIADDIIARFQLQTLYKQNKLQDTQLALKKRTEIEAGKDGLIRISVTDHSSNMSSELANAYVDELYRMNSRLAITEAAQRRVFFDQQLDSERKALAAAEEDLRTTEQKTGLIQLSGQAQMIIQTISQLRAQIASREVEIQSVRTYATDQNPEVTRLNQEISTMREQLAKLENDEQHRMQPGNIAVPAGQVAEDSLEYTRKLREVKYHDTLFDLLSRQYEAARIDEAKSASLIQVIDTAVPPDKKSGPHRLLIVLGFGVCGAILACVVVFLRHLILRISEIPENANKIHQLGILLGKRS